MDPDLHVCTVCHTRAVWHGSWVHAKQTITDHQVETSYGGPTCPLCGSPAYVCFQDHVDGKGPRLHCRSASLHNFPIDTSKDH